MARALPRLRNGSVGSRVLWLAAFCTTRPTHTLVGYSHSYLQHDHRRVAARAEARIRSGRGAHACSLCGRGFCVYVCLCGTVRLVVSLANRLAFACWIVDAFVAAWLDCLMQIYSLAFHPSTEWLATSSDKGTVHVFGLNGGLVCLRGLRNTRRLVCV